MLYWKTAFLRSNGQKRDFEANIRSAGENRYGRSIKEVRRVL
jgi:hypothetical protein